MPDGSVMEEKGEMTGKNGVRAHLVISDCVAVIEALERQPAND